MSIGSRVTWSNGDGSTSIIIFGGINMNKHPVASYIRVPSGSQSQYPFDSQPLWTPEVGHGLHQKCLRMGIHTFSNTVGWIYIYVCMCTSIIYRKHTHIYIYTYVYTHTYIYIYPVVWLRAPSESRPFHSSWTGTLLGGACKTCTASVKRAQFLWNVHNFLQTWTTCMNSMTSSQTLQKALNQTIPTYPHIYII